jgi:hypothetical protein
MRSASQRRKTDSEAKERQRSALSDAGLRQHTFVLSDAEAEFLRRMGSLLGIAWTSPATRRKSLSTRGDPELLAKLADKSAQFLKSRRSDQSAKASGDQSAQASAASQPELFQNESASE